MVLTTYATLYAAEQAQIQDYSALKMADKITPNAVEPKISKGIKDLPEFEVDVRQGLSGKLF